MSTTWQMSDIRWRVKISMVTKMIVLLSLMVSEAGERLIVDVYAY